MGNNISKEKMNTSFIFSSITLVLIFAASATPVPLYSIYQRTIGLTTSEISLTAVLYFVGCLISLIILSRLSDHLGRKPISVVSILLALIGLLLLINSSMPIIIIIARLFQGMACGLASSVLSVFIVESGQHKSNRLVAAITGSAVLSGLAIGGLFSGIIIEYHPDNISLVYWILSTLLVFCIIGILFGAETIVKTSGALKSLKPMLSIPLSFKQFIPAASIFAGTWAMGGYFQAFSSTVGDSVFAIHSPLLAAVILSGFFAPNIIGSSLSTRFSLINGQRMGIILFTLSIALMYISFLIEDIMIFLPVIFLGGVFWGICYTSAMQSLLSNATVKNRTGIVSMIYVFSYGGAAIPSFVSGQLSSFLSFEQLTLFYLILVIILCNISIIFLKLNSQNS